MVDGSLQGRFQLQRGPAARVGVDRIRLLEAISEKGSITAGSKAVGLTYRGGWDAVQALNALFDRPLVRSQAGGREGGVATVTREGCALILAFRRIDRELTHVVAQLEQHLADESEPLDRLIWRLGMKTSARNQLLGVVESVTTGAVNSAVVLKVGEAIRITAVVTRESVEELGLEPERPAMALVKSSFVILAAGDAPLRTSARNCLAGRVVEHRQGAVNDEVVLEVADGLRITATVTRESLDELGLRVGASAQALIKASHVILAVQ